MLRTILLSVGLALTTAHELATQPKPASAWALQVETLATPALSDSAQPQLSVSSRGVLLSWVEKAGDRVTLKFLGTNADRIHVTRLASGQWTEPVPVSKDNWQFPACPVNGPALTARGRNVAAAYFQAKDGKPKSFVAFSSDAGQTFGTPIRLDEAGSLGRVDVEMLSDGSAAVAYIDLAANRAEFRVKRAQPGGAASAPVTIANLANDRSSGYPRMALHNGELVFAWVDRDGGSSVRTAFARLGAGAR